MHSLSCKFIGVVNSCRIHYPYANIYLHWQWRHEDSEMLVHITIFMCLCILTRSLLIIDLNHFWLKNKWDNRKGSWTEHRGNWPGIKVLLRGKKNNWWDKQLIKINYVSKSNLNKIYYLQKRGVQVITNSDYEAHSAPLFSKLGILDIFQVNMF